MKKLILFNCFVILFFLAVCEVSIEHLLNHPKSIPARLFPVFRHYYGAIDRPCFQQSKTFARYDSELTYLFRPGVFEYGVREYKNTYHINSMGVRDDEDSLVAPEIVVLGDSYAMGIGVEGNETFSSLIEQATGVKVLNAGVSSYGTVRELRLLKRIDTSKMKTLIIQYCGNDAEENYFYAQGTNTLSIIPESDYWKTATELPSASPYYFGKHIACLTKGVMYMAKIRTGKRPPVIGPINQGELFLNVIRNSEVDLTCVSVIVFALDDHMLATHKIIEELRLLKANNITICDVATALSSKSYYCLDDHLTAKGHKQVATALLERLGTK